MWKQGKLQDVIISFGDPNCTITSKYYYFLTILHVSIYVTAGNRDLFRDIRALVHSAKTL